MNAQRLGQFHDLDIGNASNLGFDLGDAFPAYVPAD